MEDKEQADTGGGSTDRTLEEKSEASDDTVMEGESGVSDDIVMKEKSEELLDGEEKDSKN